MGGGQARSMSSGMAWVKNKFRAEQAHAILWGKFLVHIVYGPRDTDACVVNDCFTSVLCSKHTRYRAPGTKILYKRCGHAG